MDTNLFFILILIIILFIFAYIYNFLIKYYFLKDGVVNYDKYSDYIQIVSNNNYYMNYGLWDKTNISLSEANINLVNYIYDLMNESVDLKTNNRILDIGCGYGDQDIHWLSKLPSQSSLIAIDISQKQIDMANQKRLQLNIDQNRLNFIKCDAMKIKSLFKKNYFNCIICLESAFHYSNRKHFFSHVKSLLKTNGLFIIGDIVLKERQSNDNIIKRGFMKLFEKVFSDFFHIPFVNLISQSEWQNDITNAGLKLSYINNITEKTFVPYYKYYFNEYIKKKNYPNCLATYLLNLFTYCQPFDYVIAVFNC